jgi:hypothetical protein
MCSRVYDLQVFYSIVASYAVLVMYKLVLKQFPPKVLLHYVTVLLFTYSVVADYSIAAPIMRPLSSARAITISAKSLFVPPRFL